MKFLIITSSYPSFPEESINAGVFVREFAKSLKEIGHTVSVLTPRKGKGDYDELDVIYFWWLGKEKVLTDINLKNPVHLLKALSLIFFGTLYALYLCAKTHYDHIVAMWSLPSGLIAWLVNMFTYIPYSVWSLGSDIWMFNKRIIRRQILRTILRNATHRFADGFNLSNEVREISGKECIFLPSSRVLPPPSEVALEREKRHFLYIGRFHLNKGTDILMEAIKILPEEVRGRCNFHLFGDGPLKRKLEEELDDTPSLVRCVFLKGYADPSTASSYLHLCDALIIPSRIESVPVVLSDAAQAGIPVIATDVGDMGRILKEYRCGIVVEPEKHSLASAISEFLNKEKSEFEEGLRRLAMDFDIKRATERFIKIVV